MQNLHQIGRQEIAQAGLVLTNAFQNDPVFNAIFEGATHQQRFAFYSANVQYALKFGQVWASSSTLEGVAAWVPGKSASMNLLRLIFSGAFFTGLKMGKNVSRRMAMVFKPIDCDREAHMLGRDYTFLQLIGVAARYQGQGFGKQLLQAVIDESETFGLPIYLETETEENVSIYEHFGFTVIDKVMLSFIDLPMWEMLREPMG